VCHPPVLSRLCCLHGAEGCIFLCLLLLLLSLTWWRWQEIQGLRTQVVQVEQQLRLVTSPAYSPLDRDKAVAEQNVSSRSFSDPKTTLPSAIYGSLSVYFSLSQLSYLLERVCLFLFHFAVISLVVIVSVIP